MKITFETKSPTLVIGLILLASFNVGAQNAKVFLRNGVYSKVTTSNQLSRSFGKIDFLFNKDIAPANNGTIDYNLVKKRINEIVPDKNSSGYLCLDLEDLNYKIMRESISLGAGKWANDKINNSINNFKNLINFVKSLRPNMKVGYFGVPLRVLISNSQVRNRAETIFAPILKEVDVIYPSLYIPYKPNGENRSKITTFINLNLLNAFVFADKFEKEVIPLMWYFTASSTRSNNYIMIPKEHMHEYESSINSFRSPKGKKVSGIVWWDEVKSFYKSNLKKINDTYIPQTYKNSHWSNDKALNYYFGK